LEADAVDGDVVSSDLDGNPFEYSEILFWNQTVTLVFILRNLKHDAAPISLERSMPLTISITDHFPFDRHATMTPNRASVAYRFSPSKICRSIDNALRKQLPVKFDDAVATITYEGEFRAEIDVSATSGRSYPLQSNVLRLRLSLPVSASHGIDETIDPRTVVSTSAESVSIAIGIVDAN
jgi:hypothetical protein